MLADGGATGVAVPTADADGPGDAPLLVDGDGDWVAIVGDGDALRLADGSGNVGEGG